MELNKLTIAKAHQGLISKEFSSVELTMACLAEIKKTDDQIKAFITVTEEYALAQAKVVDAKILAGENILELAGIPYAAKDIFCTKGIKTTAASKILENFIPPYESTSTDRLNQQNSVLVGKTNLDEFAMGGSTENSGFFVTHNPYDLERVAGGSSGGSAAAVAASHCLYALGTDTGGSIRQPAAFCGVVGLKVTYGRTSRYGVMSMASSLDTIGHLTKTVEDSAVVLQAIAGQDKNDATTTSFSPDNYLAETRQDIKGLKVGIPKEYLNTEGLDPEIRQSIGQAIKKLEELTGNAVQEISLPHSDYALACYYVIMPAEVSSNLARYDGIRYGLSIKGGDLLESYMKTREHGFGAEAKRRIMLGTYVLSHGYYDAYYKKAQSVRRLVKQDFVDAFEKVDILLAPATPTPAFKIGKNTSDPLQMYLEDIFTIPASLAGAPSLSLPIGKSASGLPIGAQLIGKWFDEKTLLRAGFNLEQTGLN